MSTSTNESTVPARPDRTAKRRVLLSSLAGTTIEWYEFFIYGLASALVLNKVFFPSFDSVVGTLLSLSTFAVAFVARPVGAAIFGHFGVRLGRKNALVITLTMMGGATFLIGLLPTYATIGALAPILLVLLRLVQGLSLGGEYSGAVLMCVEHAGPRRRGLFGAIVNSGSALGLILSNLVFITASAIAGPSFLTWGWRLPFLASAVLVVLGLVVRLKVEESPEFVGGVGTGQATVGGDEAAACTTPGPPRSHQRIRTRSMKPQISPIGRVLEPPAALTGPAGPGCRRPDFPLPIPRTAATKVATWP
ncbi:MFS transporter [Saccharopolyspora hattusasensis]|uniref:MFS transporter n=1 Tax=Saccharopolyspora hattusasensis TaxID=1128679 RepID=UPI003D9A06C5